MPYRNPVERRAYNRAYKVKNRERLNRLARERYVASGQRERSRAYRQANLARLRAYDKQRATSSDRREAMALASRRRNKTAERMAYMRSYLIEYCRGARNSYVGRLLTLLGFPRASVTDDLRESYRYMLLIKRKLREGTRP